VGRKRGRPNAVRYTPEFKLTVVKTAIEKRLSVDEVVDLYGISSATWSNWKKAYRKGGEPALAARPRPGRPPGGGLTDTAKARYRADILETKRKHPYFGIARVWHWIRRTLFVPIPIRFVRRTLKDEGLLQPVVRKRRRAAPAVKRFERSTPNQMWQSDITIFQIGKGLKVYLIGFLDDHSRYLLGWGLYAGQSGQLVLDVLRRAFAEYGRPKELLTDNGRQYKSWHGVTDFQKELRREGVEHFTSRPHHPQTLGKIEAFWGHFKKEFLKHVVMGDLEEMRERIRHWVAYYNFQRPHSGIGNSTPAERYFRFDQAAKAEIERRVKENERELAFEAARPSRIVGANPVGDDAFEVRKENGDFKVYLGGRELEKENGHETENRSAVAAAGDGRGGEGEGVACPSGPVGGEVDLGGVPGYGVETVVLLQAGSETSSGDAPGGIDAERPSGTAEGSGDGSERDRGPDGGSQAGTSADAVPGADQPAALPDEGGEERDEETPQAGTGTCGE
jgi:putative transposase